MHHQSAESQLSSFIVRGPELLCCSIMATIIGLVLLARLDHLQASGRVPALHRLWWRVHCYWRPIWIREWVHVNSSGYRSCYFLVQINELPGSR
jgi:hypothetical protein